MSDRCRVVADLVKVISLAGMKYGGETKVDMVTWWECNPVDISGVVVVRDLKTGQLTIRLWFNHPLQTMYEDIGGQPAIGEHDGPNEDNKLGATEEIVEVYQL
jgi:hypothetical protein